MWNRHKTYQRQSMGLVFFIFLLILICMFVRLGYLMIGRADYYGVRAKELHERERQIKAERGKILDRNGRLLAGNRSVSTISVIHSQIKEPEKVISLLSNELELDEETVRKKVEKVSSREKVKSNVDKETSDRIRNSKLAGVTVDEDYKREYQYDSLASRVLGFTGSDNQGIIGLEVAYEKYLKGTDGSILTMTTAYGTEIENGAEDRIEPVSGWTLNTSLDLTVMEYADQVANILLKKKQAKSVDIIVMNPQNGEIYAMACAPEFNLNDPYQLSGDMSRMTAKEKSDKRNAMWRNPCVSDTYEPGSTFKILTTAAALEKGVVKMTDRFHCPGYKMVEDRRIRCHKKGGHGSETFLEGIMNSCNPVFIEVGARVGVSDFFQKMSDFGLMKRSGIDVPGEAGTIIHKQKNVGAVELATMSFGQSFQVSPIRLISLAATMVNGGKSITPHFGVSALSADGSRMKHFDYEEGDTVVTKETSDLIREALGKVVSEGTGSKAGVKGCTVGAKTGTSEKLPRGNGKYIASTIGFAPVENPQVIALVRIDEPQGLYYGGTVAAPGISTLFENILPYLCRQESSE